jgi:hypothetical protein
VLRIPPAPDPDADRVLLREVGRNVLAGSYRDEPAISP